jgi:CheY-like chemotaxis protein
MLPRLVGENIEITVDVSQDKCLVRADATQIQQILMNLAVNARDAMPGGGQFGVGVSSDPPDADGGRKETGRQESCVLLKVRDNGCGMDEETQRHIFEPFFTTKDKGKGTGLGLSIVYSIVKRSGGRISVQSAPGKGTTFNIYLPFVQEEAAIAAPQSAGAECSGKSSAALLLVDDDVGVRAMVRDFFHARGYSVLEAGDGVEALRILCEPHRKKIDLIISDVVMPRMGGRELASRLMQLGDDTRILYMSGYTGEDSSNGSTFEAGAFFINKPFTLKALALKVAEGLESAKTGVTASPASGTALTAVAGQ